MVRGAAAPRGRTGRPARRAGAVHRALRLHAQPVLQPIGEVMRVDFPFVDDDEPAADGASAAAVHGSRTWWATSFVSSPIH
ncbi:hypothetical protein ACFTY7_24940 [Streptomyces sp. NPDC057062]|uniref:hypothetical protein n=1 Tax=Streptomyces sp. NPDC057062 TaxID=3346011 RepID=UPI00362C431E